METKRKYTKAELFIKPILKRYYSIYPSEFCVLARILLSSYDAKWVDGMIYDKEHIPNKADEDLLTDKGWENLRHDNQELPRCWPDMREAHSPLREIPDNADESWLHMISTFCYTIEKISVEKYEAYIRASFALSNWTKEAFDMHVNNSLRHFKDTKNFLEQFEPHKRCWAILNERSAPKGAAKYYEVKKGSTVRLKTGVSTAIVELDELTFGNGTIKGACYLDRPLGGTRYWNIAELVGVAPKK